MIADIDRLLMKAREAGILIVFVSPPFGDDTWENFKGGQKLRQYLAGEEFNGWVEKRGGMLFDFSRLSSLNGTFSGMYDELHPSHILSERIAKIILETPQVKHALHSNTQ